jgi:hypothetical protein
VKKLIAGMTVLVCTQMSHAAVWKAENQWTPEFENKYSEWIHSSFKQDIFLKGTWSGISTDCADAAYSAHVIFSFINKLPFSIKDPTGSGRRITNEMSRFDSIDEPVARARAFVEYINDVTDTKSLPDDTYPIAISRSTLKPGTIWIRPSIIPIGFWGVFDPKQQQTPGHAETVVGVEETGVIDLLGSTVPEGVRALIPTTSLAMMPTTSSLGFRHWILPQNVDLAIEQQPGYSLEQLTMGTATASKKTSTATSKQHNSAIGGRSIHQFEEDVQHRLALRSETSGEVISRTTKELCSLATSRLEIVTKGVAYDAQLGQGACMNADEYDMYSTPSRDGRIKEVAQALLTAVGGGMFNRSSSIENVSALDQCAPLQIAPNQTLTLKEYVKNVMDNKVSSDPNESLGARWGLASASHRCPTPKGAE